MGETEYWDEFRAHDSRTGKILEEVEEGAKILFGESWDQDLAKLNERAKGMDLLEIRDESKLHADFDVKNDSKLAPYGGGTGKMLNGKYATARSAGNYLAGYNAAGGRLGIASLTRTGYMKLAGAYHVKGKLTSGMVANIVFNNASYGPAPYYGEIPYAGRRIISGWNNKKWGK